MEAALNSRDARRRGEAAGAERESVLQDEHGGANENKVVPLPGSAPRPAPPPPPVADPERWKEYAEPDSKVANGLDAIAAADPNFSLDQFIAGAKTAYEMIVTAFATGDRELLARLLDKDVFDSFNSAIDARAGARRIAHDQSRFDR